MSITRDLEIIAQNLKCLQNREAVGRYPQDNVAWDRLFENPIVDCLSVGLLILDTNYNIRKLNLTCRNGFDKYSHYSSAESIGKSYFNCFPKVSKDVADHYNYVRNSKKQFDTYEFPVRFDYNDPDSLTFWNAHVVPLTNKKHQTGIVLIAMEVGRTNVNKIIDRKNKEIEKLKTTISTILNLKNQLQDDLEEKMLANTRYILSPMVDQLKSRLKNKKEHLPYLDSIDSVLNNLGSNWAQRIGISGVGLTPKEMQIAIMINGGRTTKEISECLHVSTHCIDFHRKNIRKKLGCKNNNVNLQTALASLFLKNSRSFLDQSSSSHKG